MIELYRPEDCCGCTACQQVCPQRCVDLKKDNEGFLYPKVNYDSCVSCGLCNKTCPVINSIEFYPVKETYAAYVLEESKRYDSSSGGIFGAVAENVLGAGGIVCSVKMNHNIREAVFEIISEEKDLKYLRGSKYMQAYPQNIFAELKNYIDLGKQVLFCGTPCQVNCLKLFFGKECENLLTMDVICHGVPSPYLWQKYVNYLEKKYNSKIKSVNFRNKSNGWELFGIQASFNDDNLYFSEMKTDPYMQMFLSNFCLRPSCYDCKNKKFRLADITVGDFWGIKDVLPLYNDDKGISSVIVRTDKGIKKIYDIRNKLILKSVKYEDIIRKNTLEYTSVNKPKIRDSFYKDLDDLDMNNMIEKYVSFRGDNSNIMKDINVIGFHLYDKWLYLKRYGISLEEYFFDNGYRKIAVYGIGMIGKQLLDELKDTNIKVEFGIDINAHTIRKEMIKINTIDEIKDEWEVDAIIVTPVQYYLEIEKQIKEKCGNIIVISIEDVVEFVYRKHISTSNI